MSDVYSCDWCGTLITPNERVSITATTASDVADLSFYSDYTLCPEHAWAFWKAVGDCEQAVAPAPKETT